MGTPTGAPRMRVKSADALRLAMKLRGVSLQAVSERTEAAGADVRVSKQFVQHLTKGRQHTCAVEVAEIIADMLRLPIGDLFTPAPSSSSVRADNRQQTGDAA